MYCMLYAFCFVYVACRVLYAVCVHVWRVWRLRDACMCVGLCVSESVWSVFAFGGCATCVYVCLCLCGLPICGG